MSLNKLFDNIYCLNLAHRNDRWEEASKQFDKFNIKVQRFEATNGKELFPNGNGKLLPGEIGIIRSNIGIIEDAKKNNYKQIVIFEDDVVLDSEFDKKIDAFYNAVPKDWEFLYFGGNHVIGKFRNINSRVAIIKHTYTTHAYCIKDSMYDDILTRLKTENYPLDVIYAEFQKIRPSYVFRPHLAWQKDGFSDIQNRYENYDFLKK